MERAPVSSPDKSINDSHGEAWGEQQHEVQCHDCLISTSMVCSCLFTFLFFFPQLIICILRKTKHQSASNYKEFIDLNFVHCRFLTSSSDEPDEPENCFSPLWYLMTLLWFNWCLAIIEYLPRANLKVLPSDFFFPIEGLTPLAMNFVLSVHNVIKEHNSVSCSTSSFLSCSKNKSLSIYYLLAQFRPVASLLGQKQMVILDGQALVPYLSLT